MANYTINGTVSSVVPNSDTTKVTANISLTQPVLSPPPVPSAMVSGQAISSIPLQIAKADIATFAPGTAVTLTVTVA